MASRGLCILAAAVALSSPAAGQSEVGLSTPEASISVTTDEAAALAKSVIESSLRGVGRMFGALRGTDPGLGAAARRAKLENVRVELDEQAGRYAVTTSEGARIWIDARSGAYSIDLQEATHVPGLLIEESLAAVGSMIRGLRTFNARRAGFPSQASVWSTVEGGPLGLSSVELERLQRLWRAEGLSAADVRRRQEHLETADAGLRAAMSALDDSMDQLDHEMEALRQEMEALDRRVPGGGER